MSEDVDTPYIEPDTFAKVCEELDGLDPETFRPELRALLGNKALRFALGQILSEATAKKEQLVGVDLTGPAGQMQAIGIQQQLLGLRRAFDIVLEVVNG